MIFRRTSSLTRQHWQALNEVLHQLAARAHAAQLFVSFECLQELSERLLTRRELERRRGRRERRLRLGLAVGESLAEAHVREQARLLHAAVELMLWSSPEGRWATGAALSPPCLESWEQEMTLELDTALADGVVVDGELLACCFFEYPRWPHAQDLARAAARLQGGWRAEVAEVRAALVDSDDGAALDALLRKDLPLAERARLHEAAAVACERRAEFDGALAHYERSLADAPGPRAALAAWVLAAERAEPEVGELAWRALLATWRGVEPLGPARESYLWRELVERRSFFGAPIAEALRLECEAHLRGAAASADSKATATRLGA